MRPKETHHSLGRRKKAGVARLAIGRRAGKKVKPGFLLVRGPFFRKIQVPLRQIEHREPRAYSLERIYLAGEHAALRDKKAFPACTHFLRAVVVTPPGRIFRVYESQESKGVRLVNSKGRIVGVLSLNLGLRKLFNERLRARGFGSIMLKAIEQVYREKGEQRITAGADQVSALNFFLKNSFQPREESRDFVRRYLAAADKSEFHSKKRRDGLVDPERSGAIPRIELEKTLEAPSNQKDKHSILIVGQDGKEKWFQIPKEALERA